MEPPGFIFMWICVALSVAVFVAWMVYEIVRDWREMWVGDVGDDDMVELVEMEGGRERESRWYGAMRHVG
jgi:hypothetical protein